MNLRGITVCVGYTDLLERGIARWWNALDRLIVVTTPDDAKTIELCRRFPSITIHTTNIFTENGAKFNKGAAIAEASAKHRFVLDNADWLVLFDADIVPPTDLRERLEAANPAPGWLYGCRRWHVAESADELIIPPNAPPMPQGWVIGFFMLFHATDTNVPKHGEPLVDVCWPHAGNYDTIFCRRWQRGRQRMLDLPMIHLGEERRNWCGRGRAWELRSQFLCQRRRAEDWQRERMTNPPAIAFDVADPSATQTRFLGGKRDSSHPPM